MTEGGGTGVGRRRALGDASSNGGVLPHLAPSAERKGERSKPAATGGGHSAGWSCLRLRLLLIRIRGRRRGHPPPPSSGRRRRFALRSALASLLLLLLLLLLAILILSGRGRGPRCRFAYVSNPLTNQYDKWYDERFVARSPLVCPSPRPTYMILTFVTSNLEKTGLRQKLRRIYDDYERLHPDTVARIVNPYEFSECDGGPRTAIFKKHCVARVVLEKDCADAVMVLDADAVPVNLTRHFREWLDADARGRDLYFGRRPNNEVCACAYVARNTEFARAFLKKWEMGFDDMPCSTMGFDQGTLAELLMEHFTRDEEGGVERLQRFKQRRGGVFGTRMYLVDFASVLIQEIAHRFDDDERIRIYNEDEAFWQEKSAAPAPPDRYVEHHHWADRCDIGLGCAS